VPEVSVITNIGLDHTQFLGETLPEIAFEKAGIIKKKIPVIIGERQSEVEDVFLNKAKIEGSEIVFASDNEGFYETDLLGDYQKSNSKTAVAAIKILKNFKITEENIIKGLSNVVKNTNLLGRWQVLQNAPKTICDTAHNKEGLSIVMKQLRKENFENLHIVLGVVSDKKLDDILELFPKNATYYFCEPKIPRAMNVDELFKKANKKNLNGKKYNSVNQAYSSALGKASEKDIVYVGGSTFVVAEIL
jgi:dihydrofolate synthase/folylpolyglutamate synthase